MIRIRYIILLLLAVVSLASCELHTSQNGDLDNWWYLRQVDNVVTGERQDYVKQRVFWGYNGAIMQTEKAGSETGAGRTSSYIYRFEHKGNTLRVYEPRLFNAKKGDPLLEAKDLVKLEAHGLHLDSSKEPFEQFFTIEQLNDDRMVLNDGTHRLHFIAY